MCGLAGVLRVHDPGQAPPPLVSIPEAWLDLLDDSIKHRGPDGQGRFRDRAVRPDGRIVDIALVHRRLSILDHAGGHQPMVSLGKGRGALTTKRATGPTWILYDSPSDPALHAWNDALAAGLPSTEHDLLALVFNGCIYNHRDLRRELEAAGHAFTSDHSDTETLLHGWRQWGPEVFGRADGMHATAIWDHREAALFTSRDRAGEKPLFSIYHGHEFGLRAFASSAAACARLEVALNGRLAPTDPFWLDVWLASGSFGLCPRKEVRLEDPAEVRSTPTNIPRKWDWEPKPFRFAGSIAEVLRPRDRSDARRLTPDALDALLRDAVRSRLDADVPLSCFLSGGLDSALVAALASRERDVRTFTVRMPSRDYDESTDAARTAHHLGTQHTTLDVSLDPGSVLLRLIPQLGLPFGDSSLLPTAALCQAVRAHTTVALGGDGGDELFGGYQRYRVAKWFGSDIPYRPIPAGLIPTRDPRSRWSKLHRLVLAGKAAEYDDLLAIFPKQLRRKVLTDPDASSESFNPADPLGADFDKYLPNDLLLKSDTASMAVALEVRSPLLSKGVIDACLAAPLDNLMPRGQLKGLLKQVARRYLPPDVIDRPKRGFAIPIGDWFRTDFGGLRQLLRDHLLAPEPFGPDALGINAMIDMAYVRRMLKEHDDAGEKSLWPWKGRDHSQRLYMLLVLSIWAKWLGSLHAAPR